MDIELGLGPDYTWALAFASYSLFRYIVVKYFVIVYRKDLSPGLSGSCRVLT